MSDTFDSYQADPSSLDGTPLTKALLDAMPKTSYGKTIGPMLNNGAIGALLDALAGLEAGVTALQGDLTELQGDVTELQTAVTELQG